MPYPDIVMGRGFTVGAAPEDVWPWIVQLGKHCAGWYLPRSVERMLPAGKRGARQVEPGWQHLAVGQVIPDYGGRRATFSVAELEAPHVVVYLFTRRALRVSWSITLVRDAVPGPHDSRLTRVLLRLRMGPVKRKWLAATAGALTDLLTVAGLAVGLRERVAV